MEEIKPAFKNNNVPICFAANDKYVPLMAVTIQSIIENSNPENNYDIVILMTSINDENQVNLRKLIADKPNFSIRFINVGPYVFGYSFYTESDPTNTKFSDEIYYRVLVPALMPSYKEVIFLDADVVVLEDIANILNYDYSNSLIGAVRDYEGISNCYNKNYERTKYRISELNIKNFDNYVLSAVLVMNPQKFNEKFDVKDLLNLAVSKNWKQYDQDLLNVLCQDSTTIIDAGWNFMEDIYGTYHSLPKPLFNEFLESEKHPKIIHYSGSRKPWIKIDSKFNKYFWKYAESTPFLDELKALEPND